MAAVYESMAATFVRDGLNLAAIVAIRQFYGGLKADPEPLYYEHFPTALQQGAVRLVVFKPISNTLDPVHQDPLLHLAHEACQDILALAPSGMFQKMCLASCVPANDQDLASPSLCKPQCPNPRFKWIVWNPQIVGQEPALACTTWTAVLIVWHLGVTPPPIVWHLNTAQERSQALL